MTSYCDTQLLRKAVGREYPEQMLQQQRLCKKQNSTENGELEGRYKKQFWADTQKIDFTPAIDIILIREMILSKKLDKQIC